MTSLDRGSVTNSGDDGYNSVPAGTNHCTPDDPAYLLVAS